MDKISILQLLFVSRDLLVTRRSEAKNNEFSKIDKEPHEEGAATGTKKGPIFPNPIDI